MAMVGALQTLYENEKKIKISLFCVFSLYYFSVFICLVCVILLLKASSTSSKCVMSLEANDTSGAKAN
jgi:hypothetical protein